MRGVSGAVLIMARAPRPGACKTRLEPLLGPAGCADLQAELLRHTATWACASGRPVWVAYDPEDAADGITALLPAGARSFPQAGGDLGQRLDDAVCRVASAHAGAIIVLGTDSPTLGPRNLDALELALSGGWDACLLGAHDGGYAAIALSRPLPRAFALDPAGWGGPGVLESTLALLRRQGGSAAVLDPVADLDTPEDARRLLDEPACPAPIRSILAPALEAAAGYL